MHNTKDENSKTKMTNDEDACTHDSTWWTIEGVYEMFECLVYEEFLTLTHHGIRVPNARPFKKQ
jgi:hypothetical protein